MTTQNSIACPHCSAPNMPGSAFCESCGMALPTTSLSQPRIISADANPTSAAGAKLVSAELVKQTKRAANTLLAVAIIQLLVGSILAAIAAGARTSRPGIGVGTILVSFFCVGSIFLVLYFWARRSPLPATIVGLVIYGTLVAINVIVSVGSLANHGSRPTGLGVGWLDIVIIVLLIRGIGAALKQRRMTE